MLRLLLIEDEAPARERLAQLLTNAATPCTVAGEVDSLATAEKWLHSHPAPDLIFADIQLGDGVTLDWFRTAAPPCPVVFVTAHDDYLLEAFAAHGIAYLLKPVKRAELDAALKKYRDLGRHFTDRLVALATAVVAPPAMPRQRILAQRGASFQPVALSEVAYFVSENKLTFLVARSGERCLVNEPLATLSAELAPAQFFRVNRNYLVHAAAVKSFSSLGKGRLTVQLLPRPADEVLVSQETAAAFRQWAGR